MDQIIDHKDQESNGKKLFIQIILCFKHAVKKRITLEFYEFLIKLFPVERMIELIKKCGNQLEIRRNLVDLFSQIHINLKNLLYDDRTMFI